MTNHTLGEKVIIASNNLGKSREIIPCLEAIGINVELQGDIGISSIKETKTTFVENALDKARHAVSASGYSSIADDSGLIVPAIGGLPGIFSSRFFGDQATDEQNIVFLLNKMAGLTGSDRNSYFICVLALVKFDKDPDPILIKRTWHGEILFEPSGNNGFGYDTVFAIPHPQLQKISVANLDLTSKNQISHRGRAIQDLISQIKQCL